MSRARISRENRGHTRLHGENSRDERWTRTPRRAARSTDEILVATSKVWPSWELFKIEGKKELLVPHQEASGASRAPRAAGVGRLLVRADMNNPDAPDVLAVVPLPSPQERRRREIMLARLMLVAIDIVLAGEPLGLETARDLFREVRHCYPELVDELWREP